MKIFYKIQKSQTLMVLINMWTLKVTQEAGRAENVPNTDELPEAQGVDTQTKETATHEWQQHCCDFGNMGLNGVLL